MRVYRLGRERFGYNATKRFRVAQVDLFEPSEDNSHGGQVRAVAQHTLNGQIELVPFKAVRHSNYLAIGNALQKLADAVAAGDRFDAVNVSMGVSVTPERLKILSGEDSLHSPHPLDVLKERILYGLNKISKTDKTKPIAPETEEFEPIGDVVNGMNILHDLAVNRHIPVFVAGGNNRHINLLTTVPGVHGVGALTQHGHRWNDNPSNPFITTWAKGEHTVTLNHRIENLGPATSFATPHAMSTHLAVNAPEFLQSA